MFFGLDGLDSVLFTLALILMALIFVVIIYPDPKHSRKDSY